MTDPTHCDTCNKPLTDSEFYFCKPCGEDEIASASIFSDLELEWFRGGAEVVEVTHLVQDADIVGEETDRQ